MLASLQKQKGRLIQLHFTLILNFLLCLFVIFALRDHAILSKASMNMLWLYMFLMIASILFLFLAKKQPMWIRVPLCLLTIAFVGAFLHTCGSLFSMENLIDQTLFGFMCIGILIIFNILIITFFEINVPRWVMYIIGGSIGALAATCVVYIFRQHASDQYVLYPILITFGILYSPK